MKEEVISNWVTPAKMWIKVETLEMGRICLIGYCYVSS